jgi:hypothetical protein
MNRMRRNGVFPSKLITQTTSINNGPFTGNNEYFSTRCAVLYYTYEFTCKKFMIEEYYTSRIDYKKVIG